MTTLAIETQALAKEITEGSGIIVLDGYFSDDLVKEARERTYELARTEPNFGKYMPGMDEPTHRGIWSLLGKGEAYRAMASDPGMLGVLESVLGEDLLLSSLGAKILFPGAPAQKPHLDYPYCDLFDRHRWPQNLNSSFLLEAEVIIMLDDFTEENGATAVVPDSQRECRWPDPGEFSRRRIQLTGRAGSLIMFAGTTWHAGQANRTSAPRAAILAAYTCKCVRPLEDMTRALSRQTLDSCSDRLRRLLGMDYFCPPVPLEYQ